MKMRETSRDTDKKLYVNNYRKSITNNLAGLTTSAKDGKIRAGSGNIGQVIRKDKLVRETKPLISKNYCNLV